LVKQRIRDSLDYQMIVLFDLLFPNEIGIFIFINFLSIIIFLSIIMTRDEIWNRYKLYVKHTF